MKSFSSDLLALLQRTPGVWPAGTDFSSIGKVDLFAIGPAQNGQMIYATNGDRTVTYSGNTYQPVQYGSWSRGGVSSKVGLEASSMKLTVMSGQVNPVYFPGTSNSVLMADAIKAGLLDQALVNVYTAYFATINGVLQYGQMTGPTGGSMVEVKFVGQIKVDKAGITKCEMTVSDLRILLNQETPQMIIQAGCRWALYGAGCTLSKSSFSRTGSVGTVVNAFTINPVSNLSPATPSGTFTQGTLTWTSGKNSGLSYCVKQWIPGGGGHDQIIFDLPPLSPIQTGDAFSIAQGCDHTFLACTDFSNQANFGGCPTVPVPETAI